MFECFDNVLYFDKEHEYFDLNSKKELTSVTTVIKKYEPDFDKDLMSKLKGEQLNKSQEEILSLWDLATVSGSEGGSIIHDYLENLWKNKVFEDNISKEILDNNLDKDPIFIKKVYNNKIAATNFVKSVRSFLKPINLEMIVSDGNIAGQIDFFGYDKNKKKYIIIDYKTSKRFRHFSNYYYKEPVCNLSSCEATKFYLQTYMYKILIEKCNPSIEIDNPYIIWFNGVDKFPTLFKAPEVYQKYAQLIIDDYKLKNK